MKITQEPKFQPITITLETNEDAVAFSNMIHSAIETATSGEEKRLVDFLHKWFWNKATKEEA